MTRLQKKCFLASAALHGLLMLVIIFGAAFLGPSKEKPLPNRINVVPSRLVDEALSGGGGNPSIPRTDDQVKGNSLNPADSTPAPLPPPPKPPTVVRARDVPQPPVRPDPVRPDPAKTPVAKPIEIPKPNATVKTPAPTKDTIDLVPTKRDPNAKEKAKAEAQAREAAQKQAEYRRELAEKLGQVATGLKAGFKDGTKVDVGGPGGEAYANYASFIQAAYDEAWRVLPDLASLDHAVTVEIVIARNGRIVSQRIVNRSGNAGMDRSVQSALDRVKQRGLPAFPEGARDAEREFTIQFNLKARRLVG
jgi:TonB family protein